jgi:hypothetical protein
MTWGVSGKTQTTTADSMTDLGAQWTRLVVSWHDLEPTKGSYSSSLLSATDNAVNLSRARGIHVLIDFVDAPAWASGSSVNSTPPRNNADFTHFVSDMVTRYRGKAEAYEIWNEQNTSRFWSSGVNAGQYANLLKDSYGAVKAADPTAKVVFGGLARNDWGYLSAAYSAVSNLGSYYDVMATHPYPDWSLNGAPDVTLRNGDGTIGQQSFNGYRQVHNVMADHGDDKPIWFTEFGWSTWSGGVSQATQAAYTTQAMRCIEQDPYVQVAFYYNLRNNYWANNADSWDDQLGLTNTDFSHKPAYDAYKAYAPGNTGCAYREQSGTPTPSGTTPPAQTTTTASASPSKSPSTAATTSRTRTTLRLRMRKPRATSSSATAAAVIRFRVTVIGKVLGADAGRVTIELQHRVGGKWRKAGTRTTSVSRLGNFKRAMVSRGNGRWRIRAVYSGTRKKAPSKSAFVGFRL